MMSRNTEKKKIIIDADEEITTVIDQLRFVPGNDVALIVPQRAVILQSVVNLKLLAQEAERMCKKIVIITRDQEGIVFAQRAGIVTRPFSAEDEMMHIQPHVIRDQERFTDQERVERPLNNDMLTRQGRSVNDSSVSYDTSVTSSYSDMSSQNVRSNRLQDQGVLRHDRMVHGDMPQQDHMRSSATPSTSYNGLQYIPRQSHVMPKSQEYRTMQQTMRTNFDLSGGTSRGQTNVQRHSLSKQNPDMIFPEESREQVDEMAQYERSLAEARIEQSHVRETLPQMHGFRGTQSSSRTLDNFVPQNGGEMQQIQQRQFATSDRITVKNVEPIASRRSKRRAMQGDSEHTVSSHARFLVKGLVFGALIIVALISCVIVAPKTTISVLPKNIVIDDTVEITARADQTVIETDRRIVPARVIERDITYTKSYPSTGKGDVGAQKAQGTIMIYNAYDEKPQSVVASTRFLSENGTLFRLVKNTTIPGMKNGEPGKVEALVIADKEGNAGNIGPTRFTVPGFDGGPKKDKFYAISEVAMTGGGAGGSGVALVNENDIAQAQKDMESGVQKYVQEQLMTMIRPESEVLLPGAFVVETIRSEASASPQTMSEQFMYEIVTHVYAMVLEEKNVADILSKSVVLPDSARAEDVDMHLTFDQIKMDRENGVMQFSVKGNASLVAKVDLDSFKKDIVGKKHDELRGVIESAYRTSIEKITIESVVPQTPQFLGERISRFGFMTDVSLAEQASDLLSE